MLPWVKALLHEMSTDGVSDLAAGLSYRFLLAMFPFFIFLAALSGILARALRVDDPSQRIVERLATAVPGDAQSVLTGQLAQVLEANRPGLLSIGILGAVWAASGGIGAAMRAMNAAYDVRETRPFWRRTAISLGLTLAGGLALITAFAVLVGAQFARTTIEEWGDGSALVRIPFMVGQYLVPLLLVGIAAAVFYWALPDAHLEFRWISPGATLFVLGWFAATLGFGWYVANFGSYNATYGTLGGVVVLLVWLYVSALMMLVGAEVNAMIARAQTAGAPRETLAAGIEPREDAAPGEPERERAPRVDPAAVVHPRRPLPEGRVARAATAATGAVVGLAALSRALSRQGHARTPSGAPEGRHRQDPSSEGASHG